MSEYPIYQVDAFTRDLFRGNPAAVCPLTAWLPDHVMQALAAENNLAETAFFVPSAVGSGADFHLRWFTPTEEVELCGHATLASAYVIMHHLGFAKPEIRFESLSGILTVQRQTDDSFALDLPCWPLAKVTPPEAIARTIGVVPEEVYQSHDWVVVLASQAQVQALQPDMEALKALEARGLLVTAPGEGDVDFVSRAFFPKIGINEDPVTGSAHCALTPYWSARLQKTKLKARQISLRGGDLVCEMAENGRVILSGHARLYLVGSYFTR